MPCYINVHMIKVNSMASNASINIGPAYHNAHSAHTKPLGSNMTIGDYSPANASIDNDVMDPDFNDLGEIANPSNPNTINTI